jgi:hypothetical protein
LPSRSPWRETRIADIELLADPDVLVVPDRHPSED